MALRSLIAAVVVACQSQPSGLPFVALTPLGTSLPDVVSRILPTRKTAELMSGSWLCAG